MKRLLLIFLIGIFSKVTFAQAPDAEGSLVKWMSLKEALGKVEARPRPIIMDFYTDWCGWCKHMMKNTYSRAELAQYINTNFYPVKFNAEGKDTIDYLGQIYKPLSDQPRITHPLAAKLLQDKLVYPTTLFLNNYDKDKKSFGFTMMAQGFMDEKKIEPILIFTVENVFRNSSYDDFKDQFEKAFFDPDLDRKQNEVAWKKPAEVLGKKDSSDKKTLVLIHTEWCNSCKVMKRASFTDSANVKYLEQKFDLVDFNPEISDTLIFKGQTFVNLRTAQAPFHQLAMALCRNSVTLPTLIVMDEKQNVVDMIPFYLTPEVLRNVTLYYGDNIYKSKPWSDFLADTKKK